MTKGFTHRYFTCNLMVLNTTAANAVSPLVIFKRRVLPIPKNSKIFVSVAVEMHFLQNE